MAGPSQILPDMEVLDADSVSVGRVTGVVGAEVELADGHEVGDEYGRIPLAWVDETAGGKVRLRLTREECLARWRQLEGRATD